MEHRDKRGHTWETWFSEDDANVYAVRDCDGHQVCTRYAVDLPAAIAAAPEPVEMKG